MKYWRWCWNITTAHKLVAGVIAVSLGVGTWQGSTLLGSANENNAVGNPIAVIKNTTAPAPHASLDRPSIAALNLFGKLTQDKQTINVMELPSTTLNLELAGIIGSTFLHESRCLISESGKPAKSYFAGDTLSGDVVVYRIDKDSIILQRGDQLEKLELHRGLIGQTFTRRSLPSAAITETASATPTVSATPSKPAYKDLQDRIAAIRKKSKI